MLCCVACFHRGAVPAGGRGPEAQPGERPRLNTTGELPPVCWPRIEARLSRRLTPGFVKAWFGDAGSARRLLPASPPISEVAAPDACHDGSARPTIACAARQAVGAGFEPGAGVCRGPRDGAHRIETRRLRCDELRNAGKGERHEKARGRASSKPARSRPACPYGRPALNAPVSEKRNSTSAEGGDHCAYHCDHRG